MSAHELRMLEMLRGQAEQGRVRAGYGQLGRALSMDRQNVKHILARLEDKGVLTELEPGRAEDRMPSLYRVHTDGEIVRALEAAQRMHYVRSGNGVVFVRPLAR